jgi:Domain of unknown function (DUF5069)
VTFWQPLVCFEGCFLAILAFYASFWSIMAYNPYDLTQHPPRSPRCRLGGMVILPRLLDKARATIQNTHGEYTYGCSLDQYVLTFFGIEEKSLLAEVAKGLGDGDIFAWIVANAKHKRSGQEIASFSAYHEQRTGGSPEKRERMSQYQSSTPAGAKREDIFTWFDVLDLDDHQSFGGKV